MHLEAELIIQRCIKYMYFHSNKKMYSPSNTMYISGRNPDGEHRSGIQY
jgi:hypothetical protein